MSEVRQEYKMHSLPAVYLMEAMLPDRIVNDLNEYLDDLRDQEDRISHAGTLVGQIGNGEQLTMDHTHTKLKEFNELIQIMGADYIKNFINGQTHRLGNRVVETDELWSVHSYAGDYYNASGNSDGCITFNYGTTALIDSERLKPPQMVVMKPEVGKFFMFPSWLQHSVYPFKGEGERRTVAANLNVWQVNKQGEVH